MFENSIIFSYYQKQLFADFLQNRCSYKFRNVHQKTPDLQFYSCEYWKIFLEQLFLQKTSDGCFCDAFWSFLKSSSGVLIFDLKSLGTEIVLEIKSTSFVSQELVKFTLTFMMQISMCFMCNISRILEWKEINWINYNSFLKDFFCVL